MAPGDAEPLPDPRVGGVQPRAQFRVVDGAGRHAPAHPLDDCRSCVHGLDCRGDRPDSHRTFAPNSPVRCISGLSPPGSPSQPADHGLPVDLHRLPRSGRPGRGPRRPPGDTGSACPHPVRPGPAAGLPRPRRRPPGRAAAGPRRLALRRPPRPRRRPRPAPGLCPPPDSRDRFPLPVQGIPRRVALRGGAARRRPARRRRSSNTAGWSSSTGPASSASACTSTPWPWPPRTNSAPRR